MNSERCNWANMLSTFNLWIFTCLEMGPMKQNLTLEHHNHTFCAQIHFWPPFIVHLIFFLHMLTFLFGRFLILNPLNIVRLFDMSWPILLLSGKNLTNCVNQNAKTTISFHCCASPSIWLRRKVLAHKEYIYFTHLRIFFLINLLCNVRGLVYIWALFKKWRNKCWQPKLTPKSCDTRYKVWQTPKRHVRYDTTNSLFGLLQISLVLTYFGSCFI